jgi:hypothetical protein
VLVAVHVLSSKLQLPLLYHDLWLSQAGTGYRVCSAPSNAHARVLKQSSAGASMCALDCPVKVFTAFCF